MTKIRKAINFDLSTKDLEYFFNDTREPYSQIKSLMLKNGFEHRQYSGYVSKEPMSKKQVSRLATKICKQLPWLPYCVQKIDVTDIGVQHDLKARTDEHKIRSREEVKEMMQGQKSFKQDRLTPSNEHIDKIRQKASEVAKKIQHKNKQEKSNTDIER